MAYATAPGKRVGNGCSWLDDLAVHGTGDTPWCICIVIASSHAASQASAAACACCDRRKLRARLLQECSEAGVQFLAGDVEDVVAEEAGMQAKVVLRGGQVVKCKWVMSDNSPSASG